jgi:hypothetical protein
VQLSRLFITPDRRPIALRLAASARAATADFLADLRRRLPSLCPEQQRQADALLTRLGRRLEGERWPG